MSARPVVLIARTASILQQAFLCAVNERVQEAAMGVVQGSPYNAPGEDLKLRP